MTKLNNFQKQTEIPQAIARYLEEKQTNQAELARLAKIGEAYVSHIAQGKTIIAKSEIKDKYYEAVCGVVGYEIRRTYWRHFDTTYFAQTIMALKEAREMRTRVAIDGDTGSGKTHACREYLKRYPNETYIVTCSAIENSKEFAKNIAGAVGVETQGTAGTIIKRVIDKLCKGGNPLLIIDEAEHIGGKTGYINIVKTLADGLNGKVGFALLGMGINTIFQNGYDRRKQNFRQTARRFGHRVTLQEADFDADLVKICEETGITNARAIEYMKTKIRNFGDLESITRYALKTSETLGKKIDFNLLKSWYE